jgi:hypothetical protein
LTCTATRQRDGAGYRIHAKEQCDDASVLAVRLVLAGLGLIVWGLGLYVLVGGSYVAGGALVLAGGFVIVVAASAGRTEFLEGLANWLYFWR